MNEIRPYRNGSACRFKFKNIMQLKQTSFHSKVVKREKRKSEGEICTPTGFFPLEAQTSTQAACGRQVSCD